MKIKHFFPFLLLFLPLFAFPQKKQKPQTQDLTPALAGKAPATLAPSLPRLEAFANRVAQQAQQELRLGNRDDAFLYAEFALQYLQADNPDARQALLDAWYCNDLSLEYLNPAEKPLEKSPKTLWMPGFSGGSGWGGGWHDDVRFPWSMDKSEMTHFVRDRTGRAVQFPLHPDSAFLSAFCMSSKNRLTVFGNNTAQMRNGAGALLFRFGVADSLEYVKFVGKGKYLLCRKMSGPTELRNADTGEHLLWLEKGCCSGQQLERSELYCSAHDSVVDLFDLTAGTLLRSMPGLGSQAPDAWDRRVVYFKASPDFTKLAAIQFDGTASLFDLESGKRLSTFSIGINAFPMDFSADGAIFGTEQVRQVDKYTEYFSASLWNTYSGELLGTFDFGRERPRAMACAPYGDRVVFLVQSPRGEPPMRLAAFDIPSQRPLWTLSGDYTGLLDLISRRGNLFSAAFWDGRFASPVPAFGQFSLQQTPRLQFSPDGKWLCASGHTPLMAINVYEVATGRLLLVLNTPDDPDPVFAFSPDSRSLLVGQYKPRSKMTSHAEIWDLETMTKRHDLGGQKGRIGFVAWSPDGKRFAAILDVAGPGLQAQDDSAQITPAEGSAYEGYYQIRLFDLDPDTILVKAGRMERKKALSCEQLLGLLPGKYLDDNSLDTLAGRLLRLGDQACRKCFGWHFADLAEHEPDLAKAQKQYARAILVGEGQMDSSSLSEIYEQRAGRYLGAGMPDVAVQDAERALLLKPDNRPAQAVLMTGQLVRGQYKNAAARLVEYAAAKNAVMLHYYFSNALLHAQTGQYWRNDRDMQGNVEKCLRLITMTDTIQTFDAQGIDISPPQFNGRSQAALLAELDLPESTLTAYKMCMDSLLRENLRNDDRQPRFPPAYYQSMRAFYDTNYLLADSLMAVAMRLMRDSLTSRPDDAKAGELGHVLQNQSWIALFAQKPGAAIRAALEALELDPKNFDVLTNLGHGYLFSGQFDKAVETYRAYIAQENSAIKVLLADFFDLHEAGIWSKDAILALEAILERELTEDERADFGQ